MKGYLVAPLWPSSYYHALIFKFAKIIVIYKQHKSLYYQENNKSLECKWTLVFAYFNPKNNNKQKIYYYNYDMHNLDNVNPLNDQ